MFYLGANDVMFNHESSSAGYINLVAWLIHCWMMFPRVIDEAVNLSELPSSDVNSVCEQSIALFQLLPQQSISFYIGDPSTMQISSDAREGNKCCYKIAYEVVLHFTLHAWGTIISCRFMHQQGVVMGDIPSCLNGFNWCQQMNYLSCFVLCK